MRRRDTELTDQQWELIEPLLPVQVGRGRPRTDDRKTLNDIFFILKTGCRWKDMPLKHGLQDHLASPQDLLTWYHAVGAGPM